LDVGPDVRDLAGNKMDQDHDGVRGETTDYARITFSVSSSTTSTYTSNAVVGISDRTWSSSTIDVGQDVTIDDLKVKIYLSHTYDSDLYVVLVGPDNAQVVLSAYRGGSGDNYYYTTFDDEAAAAIASGKAPFSGSFRPEQSLSAYDGESARGTWT